MGGYLAGLVEIRENMEKISGNKQKRGENTKFPYKKARRRRKILRISGAFLRGKHVQDALRKVFLVQKRFQNTQKFSACGGHNIIIMEIRLVNAPKVYFFRACGGQS